MLRYFCDEGFLTDDVLEARDRYGQIGRWLTHWAGWKWLCSYYVRRQSMSLFAWVAAGCTPLHCAMQTANAYLSTSPSQKVSVCATFIQYYKQTTKSVSLDFEKFFWPHPWPCSVLSVLHSATNRPLVSRLATGGVWACWLSPVLCSVQAWKLWVDACALHIFCCVADSRTAFKPCMLHSSFFAVK